MKFAHLHLHTPFSFLDGGSSIQALVDRAAELGIETLAVTDHDNVSAAIKFKKAAAKRGLKQIQGVEATVKPADPPLGRQDGGRTPVRQGDGEMLPHLILLAEDADGYRKICGALTRAHLDNARRRPALDVEVLRGCAGGVIALSGCRRGEIPSRILRGDYAGAMEVARKYLGIFGKDGFFIELSEGRLPGSMMLNQRLVEVADRLGLGTVATGNVHYADRSDFPVHDLLTCVRTLTCVDGLDPERRLNAENFLMSPAEMEEVFGQYPAALRGASLIGERCGSSLEFEEKCYPSFPVPGGAPAGEMLRNLVREGARSRYGRITARIRDRLEHELDIICRLGYEDYFLIVWDIVNFARRKGIRHAGRGSAADSAVAYCLGITEVDSIGRGLLFERFMSLERAQKPDIDIDFDARYRDDVADYAYEKYGRDRVASVCTYNTYQARSAVRDIGKALGFTEEDIDRLAKRLPHMHADEIEAAVSRFPELRDLNLDPAKFGYLMEVCGKIAGFPRFLGTHLGGIVISRRPVTELTPLQMAAKGVVVAQFDKDDVEELGLIKLDLLSLRMLSAVSDSLGMINAGVRGGARGPRGDGVARLEYEDIPAEDKESYRMIGEGRTIGVFQLESPAQRALQGRLGAGRFEDLVASVALIRPGPIQGNMVEPYIARRRGIEPVRHIDPRLKPILDKTYGVVLFQEQVIEIATSVAGFTPGESDRLRRVMSHNRSRREMDEIGKVFVEKAVENNTAPSVAEQIFSYIVGYAGYGFCEAHAAAFAATAAKTAYLARHYPAEFFAAILSNQPMGYYPPETIVVEARRRGIRIAGPCVNRSGRGFTVERADLGPAIRVSLESVKGMTGQAVGRIIEAREAGPFTSMEDFRRRVAPPRNILDNLVLCGAFDSISPNRRALLWRAGRQCGPGLRLEGLEDGWEEADRDEPVSDFSPAEKVYYEYDMLGIAVSDHPMAMVRGRLEAKGFLSSRDVVKARRGTMVRVSGFPVRPHRPPTRSGRTVVFLSLEDEFGLIDITIFESVYQAYGQLIFTDPAPPLKVEGRLEQRGKGVSVIARRIAVL